MTICVLLLTLVCRCCHITSNGTRAATTTWELFSWFCTFDENTDRSNLLASNKRGRCVKSMKVQSRLKPCCWCYFSYMLTGQKVGFSNLLKDTLRQEGDQGSNRSKCKVDKMKVRCIRLFTPDWRKWSVQCIDPHRRTAWRWQRFKSREILAQLVCQSCQVDNEL